MNEKKEFNHFCDNPICPNYTLKMNDEQQYHVEIDKDAVGGMSGILKTHKFYYKKVIPTGNTFMGRGCSHTVVEKIFYFCDNCKSAVSFYKENMHE